MPNLEIPQLTQATTPLDGTEEIHIVQAGNSRRLSVMDLLGSTSLPAIASGDAGKSVVVNSAETGFELTEITGGGSTIESYTSARYWRLANLVSTSGNVHVIAELELASEAAGAEISGTWTASTEAASEGIANINDNDNNTQWASTNSTDGVEWVQLDLGSGNESQVREVRITARSGSFSDEQTPVEWELWSSDDGTTWRVHGQVEESNLYGSSEQRTFDVSYLTSVAASATVDTEGFSTARYWRMAEMVSATGEAHSMAEVSLRATISGASLSGTASASSVFSGSPASQALDGNTATNWSSNTTTDGVVWWQIDLGSGNETTVQEVVVTSRNDSFSTQTPFEWALWSSQDGTAWKIHGTVDDGDTGNFGATETRNYNVSNMTATILGSGSSSGGATTFIALADTPSAFGTAGQKVVVNSAGNGLEFVDDSSGGAAGFTAPTLARYWRLLSVGSGTRQIAEIELLSPSGQDVGQDQTWTGGGSNLENLNDGNPLSNWTGTSLSSPTLVYDAGVGNQISVAQVAITAISTNTNGPTNVQLQWSDDNTNWNVLATTYSPTGWGQGERRVFDFSADTGSGSANAELAAAIDELAESAAWRGEVSFDDVEGLDADISAFTTQDNGKPLVWDQTAGAFVLGDQNGAESILGGGTELILAQNMAGIDSVTVNNTVNSLLEFDEVIFLADGITSAGGSYFELSNDEGITAQALLRWNVSGGTPSSQTRPFFQSSDNDAAFSGHARLEHHALSGVPTMIQSMTVADSQDNAAQFGGMVDSPGITNAVTFAEANGDNFTAGTLYVIGIKKSRQPLDQSAQFVNWGGNASVEYLTFGLRLRSGVVGRVETSSNVTTSTTVNIKNGSGTVLATGVIGAGGNTANLTAASQVETADKIVFEIVEADASNTLIAMIRGEAV